MPSGVSVMEKEARKIVPVLNEMSETGLSELLKHRAVGVSLFL